MHPRLLPKLTALLLLAAPLLHAAETKPAEQVMQALADAEEQLDEGLKRFGYLSGLALGCVDKSQRTQFEREVMDVNAGIVRALGTDRAFLYAASFGYGSHMQIKLDECKTVLTRYDERIAKFRKGQQEGLK
ncbi:hypothetical protein [Chitinilyticum piscinae]|uniref:Uncharacterized protein n=1 Tax=Chitinilyticum piscinae TaxID=2866724 RepID=A0A8J7FR02_9NEIS|nr:hypothetical protein [Chitinilyticum piscinae]MBE9609171.1 hypothetical protein [Chitinilyticum piscinae]